jgi:ureidoacrylate peracid hydrolase
MHAYEVPAFVTERVMRRMGREFALETIEAARTALVVVDMQNYFCAEGFPAEVPLARAIVPNINRMARSVRAAGGAVVWIQTSSSLALTHWRNFQSRLLSPARQARRMAGLDEASKGYELYCGLDALADDIWVKKVKYSAFAPDSSDLDERLRARGIDTVLVAGTLTNVCCETTARDAMLAEYKTVMLSDGNATLTDEEHAAALNTFRMYFGDVMTTRVATERMTPRCRNRPRP